MEAVEEQPVLLGQQELQTLAVEEEAAAAAAAAAQLVLGEGVPVTKLLIPRTAVAEEVEGEEAVNLALQQADEMAG